jgi:hypothetical protein
LLEEVDHFEQSGVDALAMFHKETDVVCLGRRSYFKVRLHAFQTVVKFTFHWYPLCTGAVR